MNTKSIIFLIIVVTALGAAGWFFLRGFDGNAEADIEKIQEQVSGGTLTSVEGGKQRYENSAYRFSMEIPEGYTIGSFPEGAGTVVLVQSEGGAADDFQIFISPFDEPGPITPQRIVQDLPDMRIANPQLVVIGGGVEALIFETDSEAYGAGREVWFVRGEHLYQLSAPMGSDAVIGPMLESLTFSE